MNIDGVLVNHGKYQLNLWVPLHNGPRMWAGEYQHGTEMVTYGDEKFQKIFKEICLWWQHQTSGPIKVEWFSKAKLNTRLR